MYGCARSVENAASPAPARPRRPRPGRHARAARARAHARASARACQRRRLAHRHGRLDEVPQLAHVAREVEPRQRVHRLRRDQRRHRPLPARVAQEMLDQERDVVGALAQRRHGHRHHRQPVEQVQPEAAAVHLGAQIAVRRRHHAHVDRDLGAAAEPAQPPPLEHAQERRLHRRLQLADLVEEHRPAVRRLERADVRALGARERARLVAEQLAADQASAAASRSPP